jgi:hypothetical protein
MTGTTTDCPTSKNTRGMMMIFYSNHERGFHADGFLLKNRLTIYHITRSVRNQSIRSSIKIP